MLWIARRARPVWVSADLTAAVCKDQWVTGFDYDGAAARCTTLAAKGAVRTLRHTRTPGSTRPGINRAGDLSANDDTDHCPSNGCCASMHAGRRLPQGSATTPRRGRRSERGARPRVASAATCHRSSPWSTRIRPTKVGARAAAPARGGGPRSRLRPQPPVISCRVVHYVTRCSYGQSSFFR